MRKLDKALATSSFISQFSLIRIFHLLRYGSDNDAVKIDLDFKREEVNIRQRHLFRFKEVWAKDDRCENKVNAMLE